MGSKSKTKGKDKKKQEGTWQVALDSGWVFDCETPDNTVPKASLVSSIYHRMEGGKRVAGGDLSRAPLTRVMESSCFRLIYKDCSCRREEAGRK